MHGKEMAPCFASMLIRNGSLAELKPLEATEFLLDPALQILARVALRGLARADPAPFLQQQFPVLPVGLQIDRGDDVVADQHRQREVTELAFGFRHIGLEAMLILEKQLCPPTLDDQRIKRREDVDEISSALRFRLERRGLDPMLLLAGAIKRDRKKLAAPHPRLDQLSHGALARRVEMA